MYAAVMTAIDESLRNKSTLYQDFLAERDEILRHKWIESEKAGYDIGFERALTDWSVHHRGPWRRWHQSRRAGLS
ncbi:MAG: DUF4032 domain-containing protein [Verrucomicrobia bacterium]|jgi:hypothetical protein|nr:DUF4032 domain-containing protein [Verrucomicrobiota bacterium]OQC67146.1 MAG: hypothetical protein BWX48_00996 [Verrucomicrobia bacterium ADurb.Bin006]MDI9382606.1 DUF4032 domain-containing protein [Verrucomicrobiota bacterium]NMD19871.1 DUF4032 domain-containing protein [Verrucomicrobiota bacterium]HNU98382.1 DUF4032 domain-containing protein [Verrucomicrobiota bacterium]